MRRTPARPAERPRAESFGRSAVIIFLVALAVRLIHLWQIRDAPFFSVLMGDSRGYDEWARQLAAGDWIGREVFYQAPLYPYFLGLVYTLAGRDLLVVRIVQAIVGALSSVALGYAGHRLVSPRVGLASGLMLALYAPAIFFDALIQKSILDVFFVCVALAIVARLSPAEGARLKRRHSSAAWAGLKSRHYRWLALGLVMGGLSLTRENAMVFIVVLFVWAIVGSRVGRRGSGVANRESGVASRESGVGRGAGVTASLRSATFFALGLAIVLVPVAARNYAVGGGFYLTTSQFGSNLYIGNNPRADGSYMSLRFGRGAPEYERQDARELAEQAVGRSLAPSEVSRYWTDRTLAYIRSQPGHWLRLMARKTRLLWSSTEVLDTESQETHAEWSWPLRLGGYVFHFGVLLPLAVIGVYSLWPERRRLWVIYAMWAAYAASVIAFFVFARYRFPMVPFVVLFAAAGLVSMPSLVRTRPRRQLAVLASVALAAALAANWPVHSAASMRAITENNLATALQSDGRIHEAIDHYQRALALDPDYAPALGNLGTALRAAGRTEEAAAAYERALQIQPDFPTVHYNLGNLRLAQGQADAAAAAFGRAAGLAPSSVETHNNLGLALEKQGRLDAAIAEFRRALAIDDRSAQAHSNLGNALATKGNASDAIAHLKRSTELDPANASTRYDLGSVLLELGQADAAIVEFREALRIRPDMAEAHNNLGIALASTGRLDQAIDHWETALKIRPGFADAQRNLSMATKKRGS